MGSSFTDEKKQVVYEYSEAAANQFNLYTMAVKKTFVLNEPQVGETTKPTAGCFEDDVKMLIDDNITIPMQEAYRFFEKTEGPICPLTISTYRSVAFKKLKMNL